MITVRPSIGPQTRDSAGNLFQTIAAKVEPLHFVFLGDQTKWDNLTPENKRLVQDAARDQIKQRLETEYSAIVVDLTALLDTFLTNNQP